MELPEDYTHEAIGCEASTRNSRDQILKNKKHKYLQYVQKALHRLLNPLMPRRAQVFPLTEIAILF